jgi:adenylosuccinate synthase
VAAARRGDRSIHRPTPIVKERQAIIVVDLAFGDCGKGTTVDFLTRRFDAHTVVRFNGGPQAGHNVVTPQGLHHTFSQFGAGTFVPGVRTLLSRFMLIEPYALFNEAHHLEQLGIPNPLSRLLIDSRCLVITPIHQAANRLRELTRGAAAHGTCGLGIGETVQESLDNPELLIRASELSDSATLLKKLKEIRNLKIEPLRDAISSLKDHPAARQSIDTLLNPSWIEAAIDNYTHLAARARIVDERGIHAVFDALGTVIFEGAQGVLLDEHFGYHPHTTWSNTTFHNAHTLLSEAQFAGQQIHLGVLRTYFTRHGAGPFMTEDNSLRPHLPEPHNSDAGWQGRFRVGLFDAVAARYALSATAAIDGLVVSHVDRLKNLPPKICTAYENHLPVYQSVPHDNFLQTISHELKTPIALTSHGPRCREKHLLHFPNSTKVH